MSPKKATKAEREENRVYGFDVVIARENGRETLVIDGKPHKFDKSDAGYVLRANVYAEPQETLSDAVNLYLQRYAKED